MTKHLPFNSFLNFVNFNLQGRGLLLKFDLLGSQVGREALPEAPNIGLQSTEVVRHGLGSGVLLFLHRESNKASRMQRKCTYTEGDELFDAVPEVGLGLDIIDHGEEDFIVA